MRKLIYLILAIILSFFVVKVIRAENNFCISSNIRLSVCGDLIAEFPENCDNNDLRSQTCQSLGLTSGQLSCDIACDFNTGGCLGTPTPTPSPVPTITPIPQPTSSSITPTSSQVQPSSSVPTSVPLPTSIPTPSLPQSISFYDFDGDGHLQLVNLVKIVKTWINSYLNYEENNTVSSQEICDTNRDKNCDITDFSILLYYIGK